MWQYTYAIYLQCIVDIHIYTYIYNTHMQTHISTIHCISIVDIRIYVYLQYTYANTYASLSERCRSRVPYVQFDSFMRPMTYCWDMTHSCDMTHSWNMTRSCIHADTVARHSNQWPCPMLGGPQTCVTWLVRVRHDSFVTMTRSCKHAGKVRRPSEQWPSPIWGGSSRGTQW